jgi:hypothetical protein
VIILDSPLPALPCERADVAVRDRLGVRRLARRCDDRLQSAHDMTGQGGVAREVDRDLGAVAEHEVGARRFVPLDRRKETVVEAELVDDARRAAHTLRRRLFALPGRLTKTARRWTLHLPARWPWQTDFIEALTRIRALPAAA